MFGIPQLTARHRYATSPGTGKWSRRELDALADFRASHPDMGQRPLARLIHQSYNQNDPGRVLAGRSGASIYRKLREFDANGHALFLAIGNFKPGDTVTVARGPFRDGHGGWNNAWAGDLSRAVGRSFKVQQVNAGGVVLRPDDYMSLGFPAQSLRLVEPEPATVGA